MLDRVTDGKDGSVRFALECPASACRARGDFPRLVGTELGDIVRCPTCGETYLLEWDEPFESPINAGRFGQGIRLRPAWDTRPEGRFTEKMVRHKDGNPRNNEIGNLEIVPVKGAE